MAKRIIIKEGDLFCVPLDNDTKAYFQFLMLDMTQLNSEVIRVFQKRYPIDANPKPEEIVQDTIDFSAHCIIKIGVKLGLWSKVGKHPIEENPELPYFRGTNDYGLNTGIKISDAWYCWRPNEKTQRIGLLTEETQKYNVGVVFNPYSIIAKVQGKKVPKNYPD